MGKLLDALAGCEYLGWDAGRYALAPIARKWLLADSPQTLRDKMLWQFRSGTTSPASATSCARAGR